jgi:peptidoglycan hydrolase CwlO-like protein
MFGEWAIITIIIVFVLFMFVRMFYYKSLAGKEEKNSAIMRITLQEAEILIRKYQLQLQRALGNIDILSEELTTLRNEIKAIKQRNSQYRIENEKAKARIKDLEQKIEALL